MRSIAVLFLSLLGALFALSFTPGGSKFGVLLATGEEVDSDKAEEGSTAGAADIESSVEIDETDIEDPSADFDDESDDDDGVAESTVEVDSVNLDAMTEEELALFQKESEPHEFQAEVYRLMDIIINSLYSRKEVFLRELISNAADALEKTRFLAIENADILGDNRELKIVVEYDTESKTVSVSDTGIGMTKQDLINNLGTVAKSGTTNFLEAVAKGGDVNLVGQFGVGFYSAFLVADKVTVTSKSNDDAEQHIWESTADASFSVAKDPRGPTLGRGTRITLHLKEDAQEFLKKSMITELITKYSQFVNFPIFVKSEKTVTEEVHVPEEELDEPEKKDGDEVEVKDEEEKVEKPKTKKIQKIIHEMKKVNVQKPIWMRPKEEVSPEEYHSFYKVLVKSDQAPVPVAQVHFAAEGEIEFRAILFVPASVAEDPYMQYFNKKHEIKLYVRRVLVSEAFEDIIPNWLGFMKGVIDSDDLPLKVDRESVSQLKAIKVISKRVTRKVLDALRKISTESEDASGALAGLEDKVREEGREIEKDGVKTLDFTDEEKSTKESLTTVANKYQTFWHLFGRNVKLGCVDDDGGSRTKIAKLLRYNTTHSLTENVSLQKVYDRASESQSSIYYLTGESVERMMKSPLIKGFLKKDVEVLLLSDAVDEACISALGEFDGKKFVSIEKGDVLLEQSEDDTAYFKKLQSYYKPLTVWWKKSVNLELRIIKVQLSNRLHDDPVGVASTQYGTTAFGEKLMRYQTFVDTKTMQKPLKQLEINPNHPIIRKMRAMHDENPESEELRSLADGLAEAAILSSGFSVENPQAIAAKLYKVLAGEIGVESEKDLEPIDLSDFETDEQSQADTSGETDSDVEMPDFSEAGLSPEQIEQLQEMVKNQPKSGGGASEDDTGNHDEL